MGYGIDIRPVYTNDDGTLSLDRIDEEIYLSYNWSNLSTYFSVYSIIGRCGEEVAVILQTAIDKLKSEGVEMAEPDTSNDNWGWGLYADKSRMSENVRKGVFLYHLNYFLKVANKYPESYFFCDIQDISTVYKDGVIIGSVNRYPDDSSDFSDSDF